MQTRRSLVLLLLGLGLSACEPQVVRVGQIAVPLETRGGEIVDATGAPVVLRGVNWFGIETEIHVVHGLWARSYRDQLRQIRALGYDTIRLPWSIESLRASAISGVNFSLGENAELQGLSPIQAMDRVIEAARQEGLLVLLDNHHLDSASIPELWYGDGYTEQDWIDTWVMLATRYAAQPNVIGADLKNEPHGAATWGTGVLATDWRLAAERAGNAILARNPRWLVVVEGIGGNVAGQQLPGHWWGGNLEGVRQFPVRLSVPDRLVYSPHEYGPGVFQQAWFSAPDLEAVLLDRWEKGFAYIAAEGIAPILVGEFGGRGVGLDTVEGRWQNLFVDFLAARGLSFTYWSWNPNSSDTGGILQDDWRTVNAAKQAMLDRLLAGAGPPDDPPPPPPPPSGALVASVRVTDQWPGGYCAQLSVTNAGTTTVTGVGLRFVLAGATFTTTWNGTATAQGTSYAVALPDWASVIEAGVTEDSFGYCAVVTGASPYPTALAVD